MFLRSFPQTNGRSAPGEAFCSVFQHADWGGSYRDVSLCSIPKVGMEMPTACGTSAQEAKEARAGLAAKHIRHARPHGGQPHQIHHRQPQEERHPHHALRTATRLLRRDPCQACPGTETPVPALWLPDSAGVCHNTAQLRTLSQLC